MSLLLLGTVFSALTLMLGALPMRVIWTTYGRTAYWTGHLAILVAMLGASWFAPALLYGALVLLVGVYSEAEDHGSSVFYSAALGILTSIGTAAVAIGGWLFVTKASLMNETKAFLASANEQMTQLGLSSQVKIDSITEQLPAGMIITLMVTLAIALIWDRRLMSAMGFPPARVSNRSLLRKFQVPDLTVWIVMLAILGAFLQHGQLLVTTISINALYVFTVLYFFQGLAVVCQAFETYKVSPFWQGIWYVLIVLQLFLLVSLIGFVDFWLEFRDRLARKPAETNKGYE
jgi:hypothetical protein